MRHAIIALGLWNGGYITGGIVFGLMDGSPYQFLVAVTLMAFGGFLCAMVPLR